MSGDVQGISFDQLSAQLQQGVNLYEVIGKLYVATVAKDQAIGLAAQAIKALMPEEKSEEPAVFARPEDLPSDAPEGTVAYVGVDEPDAEMKAKVKSE